MRDFRWIYGLGLLTLFGLAADFVFADEPGELFEGLEAPWVQREKPEEGSEKEEEIETDRDSFTPATTTVHSGRLVFESSYSFIENRRTANDNSFPEIITRVGLTERLELRLGWNYEVGGGGAVSNGDAGGNEEEPGIQRDSQMLYGFKYALTKQQGWRPQSACIVQATTPTSGAENHTDLQLAYVAGWKLFESLQLDSSIRYSESKEKGDNFNIWAPSVVLKIPVMERWAAHAEYFALVTEGKANNRNQQYFSPGVHYLINPNCEVGVRVGWGLTEDAASFFSNVGIGLQF